MIRSGGAALLRRGARRLRGLPGVERSDEHAYFDDNGSWAIAYLDAYDATAERHLVAGAELAFDLIATSGWDTEGGGVRWRRRCTCTRRRSRSRRRSTRPAPLPDHA